MCSFWLSGGCRFVVQKFYNQQITPSADPTKVVYNESLLVAFDQAIAELSKRNLKVRRQSFMDMLCGGRTLHQACWAASCRPPSSAGHKAG